ncbi:MAG: polysaccharide biosynthesis protein [Prevotella sp.]|nr:polysaccharide biosynthesis protein [Prevotella sp.]
MNKITSSIYKDIKRVKETLLDWYLSKKALPYWSIIVLDSLICFISGLFVLSLFTSASSILTHFGAASRTICVYMIFNLIGFRVFHTYTGIIRYSSFVDLRRVLYAMILSCFIAEIMHYPIALMHIGFRDIFDKSLFVSLRGKQILAMYLLATILMWAWRILVKTIFDVSLKRENSIRTLIYGVGNGAVGLAKNIRNQKEASFSLQGFLTSDSDFKGKTLAGEKVYLIDEFLKDHLEDLHTQAVLVSPLQTERFRKNKELQDLLLNLDIKIYMVEGTKEWTKDSDFSTASMKQISVEDLLPREQIEVDMKKVGEMLTGKKILVTGSAGSIGSEIVRQICAYNPSEMLLVDSAETPQHDIRLMMHDRWPNIKTTALVCSISNASKMEYLFKNFNPDYVFHAAAYKHVPMMEDNPSESVHNNIFGTKVIADLSVKYGVKKFVMLSTDKAVNPTNVMGCSKRICEIYVQSLDKAIKEGKVKGITQFVTTRFGNVLGSNGSVIPLFERQIKAGGPVTVTDERIIRFFMLIPEACKLVLEAGTHGNGGEIFVFDMGEPVKISDLAKRMIKLSGVKNVKIEYTGLRPGEKLYEELLSTEENTKPSFHEKIRIAEVREYDYDEVEKDIDELVRISETYDDMNIVAKMKEIVPEYKSNNSVFQKLDKK